MKLPNAENAVVPAEKIAGYLLSETHADGKHKARFFRAFGFSLDDWKPLELALRKHVADHEVVKVEPSPYGMRHVVEGIMTTPDGRSPFVRTVWFFEDADDIPRLVSAYPLREKRS